MHQELVQLGDGRLRLFASPNRIVVELDVFRRRRSRFSICNLFPFFSPARCPFFAVLIADTVLGRNFTLQTAQKSA